MLSSQLIVLVFMKQISAERYLANFFRQYFCKTLAAHQNTFRKVLESSQKPFVPKSYVSKVAGPLQEQPPDAFCKKVFLERCSQNVQKKACVSDSILIKLHS